VRVPGHSGWLLQTLGCLPPLTLYVLLFTPLNFDRLEHRWQYFGRLHLQRCRPALLLSPVHAAAGTWWQRVAEAATRRPCCSSSRTSSCTRCAWQLCCSRRCCWRVIGSGCAVHIVVRQLIPHSSAFCGGRELAGRLPAAGDRLHCAGATLGTHARAPIDRS